MRSIHYKFKLETLFHKRFSLLPEKEFGGNCLQALKNQRFRRADSWTCSSGSRTGHKVTGTWSKFPNLNENGQKIYFL